MDGSEGNPHSFVFLDTDSIFIFVVQDPGMPKWHSRKNLVFRRAEFYFFLSRELEVFTGAWKAFIEINT
jgi:hypothetical protein